MSVQSLRIGMVGANAERGWAGDAHLPALQTMPDLCITAVSARTAEIAEGARAKFAAAAAYGDSLALTRDPAVDIVTVCVKVPEHRAVVLAALAAGKHVYCEWPLGLDTAEATELAQAATRSGTHVAIGLQGANSDAVREVAALVAAGRIGMLRSINMVSPTGGWGEVMPAHYAYLQDRKNGGTVLTIPGGHSMAAIEMIAGPYLDIQATGTSFVSHVKIHGTDQVIERSGFDHAVIIGRHAGGSVSTLEIVAGTMEVPLRFELRGSKGTIAIEGGSAGGYQAGVLTVSGAPATAPPITGPGANVATLYARFAADIRNGTRTVPDFNDAVRLHSLLDAVEQSAATGCRVTLKG